MMIIIISDNLSWELNCLWPCTFPDFIYLWKQNKKNCIFWCKQSARNPVVTPWLGIVAINSLDRDKSKFGRFIWLMRKNSCFFLESQWKIKLWQRHKKDWQIGNYKCKERKENFNWFTPNEKIQPIRNSSPLQIIIQIIQIILTQSNTNSICKNFSMRATGHMFQPVKLNLIMFQLKYHLSSQCEFTLTKDTRVTIN